MCASQHQTDPLVEPKEQVHRMNGSAYCAFDLLVDDRCET